MELLIKKPIKKHKRKRKNFFDWYTETVKGVTVLNEDFSILNNT